MKKILFVSVIFFFYCFAFSSFLNADDVITTNTLPFKIDSRARISLDFQDARLKDILKVFSIQAGLNFIASEAVQDRTITLYLDNVPVKEAIDRLFWANNLTYEYDPESNIMLVKEWGKPEIETVTRVFNLKYARVSNSSLTKEISSNLGGATGGIIDAVKNVLSSQGKIVEDPRTNSLVVTDIPSRMSNIGEVIKSMDNPEPQVMLEVEMLDVSKNTVDTLGIKFGQTPLSFTLTGSSTGISLGLPFNSWGATSDISSTNNSTLTFNANYNVLLDFLRKQTDTKYLARPRILTLNNETAEIKITTQETVGTTTTTQGQGTASTTTQSTERVETGVSLRVTPQVNLETGEITMCILPTVKDTVQNAIASITSRDPEERSTKSTVRVKDGETIVVGGLIRNEKSQTITKLPILGDIPLIGAFFRHKDKTKDKERELLIFITPRIVKDRNMELAKAGVTLQREQDPVLDRRAAITTSLDFYDKVKIDTKQETTLGNQGYLNQGYIK